VLTAPLCRDKTSTTCSCCSPRKSSTG
jgi:hypothetical protein